MFVNFKRQLSSMSIVQLGNFESILVAEAKALEASIRRSQTQAAPYEAFIIVGNTFGEMIEKWRLNRIHRRLAFMRVVASKRDSDIHMSKDSASPVTSCDVTPSLTPDASPLSDAEGPTYFVNIMPRIGRTSWETFGDDKSVSKVLIELDSMSGAKDLKHRNPHSVEIF